MKKQILSAIGVWILGVLVGQGVARYTQAQHREQKAVMSLAQFHLRQLDAAARSGQCAAIARQRENLARIHGELIEVFPLAYGQEVDFRRHADALRDAVRGAPPAAAAGGEALDAPTACATAAAATLKSTREACDGCHREYR